jgi:hypothetical protein
MPAFTTSPLSKRIPWWVLLLLALVSIGVYANSIANDFTYDDIAIVRDNVNVQDLNWTQIWSDNYWQMKEGYPPDVLYRPLTIWSYLANQATTPGAAWAFHLTNVLLNALVVVMVALLAWRIFGNRTIAVLAGLLFALHPLHTEVVANVVGRAEILAALGSLAAMLVYLPNRPLPGEGGPENRGWWHGGLVALCFLAAILCKETPVTLLLVFVLIDFWRWSYWPKAGDAARPQLMHWLGRQSLRYYLPLAGAFGIYLAMRIHATGLMADIRSVHPLVNMLVTATIPERIITPFLLLAKYLSLTFWPAVLSADYSAPSIAPTANPFEPLALIGILVTVLAAVLAIRHRRAAGPLILVLGLFAASYALVANVIRIGTIFGERLFYMPGMFVLMIVAWTIVACWHAEWTSRLRHSRSILAVLVAAGCVAMTVRTMVRNRDWHDNVTLAISTASNNPQSAKACYWAGVVLTQEGPQPWMVSFGAELMKRSIELFPTYGDTYWELAKYYGRRQDLVNSCINVAKAAQYAPGKASIRQALGILSDDMRNHPTAAYLPQLTDYRDHHLNDASAHLAMAVALRGANKLADADAECTEALKLDHTYHEAGSELAMIQFDEGKSDQGIVTLRQYVMTISRCFDARCTLARELMALDIKTHPLALIEAQHNLERAVEIVPGTTQVRELRAELRKKIAASVSTAKKTADARPPVLTFSAAGVAMGGTR